MFTSVRLLEPFAFPASMTQDTVEAFDAGEYTELNIAVRVIVGGSGTLYLQHAPVRATSAFANLGGTSVSLASPTVVFVQVKGFSRYIQ